MCVLGSLPLKKITRPVLPVSGSHFEDDSKVHRDVFAGFLILKSVTNIKHGNLNASNRKSQL